MNERLIFTPFEPASATALVISRVVVDLGAAVDVLTIFNRAVHISTLTVRAGDGKHVAKWLMPNSQIQKIDFAARRKLDG